MALADPLRLRLMRRRATAGMTGHDAERECGQVTLPMTRSLRRMLAKTCAAAFKAFPGAQLTDTYLTLSWKRKRKD